ncbi:ComF family protein [Alkalihalobacillus trypoxylicola]|uniref:ComF family protein n=1 Tax=Alkalihalobacillus trypoxylicola TaxID=519424 RepID=UPI000AB4435E|nr:ComF family protein [Alkalihalobacillus trypoxylicola]
MSICLFCHHHYIEKPSWSKIFSNNKSESICQHCLSNLKKLEGNRCTKCSRILLKEYSDVPICYDCNRWEKNQLTQSLIVRNYSLYRYNSFLKEILATFKYRGDTIIASYFSQKLFDTYQAFFSNAYVICIPLSKERLHERGFNQAELLVEGWPNKEYVHLLMKNERSKQSKKSRRLRLQSFQDNPFFIEKQNIDLSLNNIVLVDDIYTTGTTIRQAAIVLKQAGANQIFSITIAR